MARPKGKERMTNKTIRIPTWLNDELLKHEVKNISPCCVEALQSLIPAAKARQEQREKSLSIFTVIENTNRRYLDRILRDDLSAEEDVIQRIQLATGYELSASELHPMIISVLKGVKGEG
jgi:hypothetical protein